MTVSSTDGLLHRYRGPAGRLGRTGHPAALAVLLIVLPLGAALAEAPPVSLLPSTPPAGDTAVPLIPPSAAPVPLAPPSGSPAPMAPTPLAPTAPAPLAPSRPAQSDRGGIQVQDLSAPDFNATGVLDKAHGGFGSDMWAGTSIATVEKVLPMLPTATPWRSIAQLERRLLLTAAAPPAGKASGDSLVKLRADKLWALGDVDGVSALLKGLPDQAFTPDLRRLQVDAALLAGDTATACQQAQSLRQPASTDTYPAKLQVFCQFAAGKPNEAGLGVDVLREQKVADPDFFAAADALAGIAPGKLDSFANATPLDLAMARLAKLHLPESAAGTQSAAILRAIAQMADATTEARLIATEKAEAMGALDTEVLRQIYQSVTFTDQELSAPLTAAGTDKGMRSRALLYRAAEQQIQPAAKAELIGRALALAGDGPAYFTAARLYAPLIAGLRPAPELAGFAYPAARALYAAQKADAAAAWLAFARSLGQTGDGAATAQALWPLARLAATESDRPVPAGALDAWRKARGDLPPATAQRRSAVALGLLSAIGDKVPADDWLALYDAPPPTPAPPLRPVLWHGLRMAVDDLRQAETVMFALVTAGDLAQADPVQLYRVVAALRLIGLDADARALALEAAIANGV